MSNKQNNPNLYFLFTIIISVTLTVAFWIHLNGVMDNQIENSRKAQIEQHFATDIRFYDEVLTNSAMLAATTGDERWEKRYRIFEPILDKVINDTLQPGTVDGLHQMLHATDSANIRLVAMENRVFDLVREGKQNEAFNIVNGSEYAMQKTIYSEGLTAFIAQQTLEIDQEQILLREEAMFSQLYFGVLIILLILGWLLVARFVRKRSKQIEKINQELNLLLENAPAMTYSCLAYGNFDATYISANIQEKLGYTTEEFLKIPGFWAMNIHPDDKERVFAELSNLFEKGEYQHKYRFKHKNGGWRWMSDSLKLLNDSKGAPKEILGYWQDITESKKAQEDLVRSNLLMNSILKNIPNMVFLKEAKTLRMVRFNKAGEDLLGIREKEILGKNDYDFYPKEQADFFVKTDREVIRSMKMKDIPEEPVQTRHFGTRILHTKKVPILNELGEPEYLLGISEDITERKKAEIALQKLNDQLNTTLDALPIMLFEVDCDGRIYDYRAPHAELLYAPPEMFLGKTMLEVLPADAYQIISGAIAEAATTGNHKGASYSLHTPSGLKWFELSISIKNSTDLQQPHFIVLVNEFTERHQTEEKITMLAKAIENTAECIAITDKNYQITFVNESFLKTTGYAVEEIIGQPIAVIISENNLPEIKNNLYPAIAKRKNWMGEVINKRKDGIEFPSLLSLAPLLNDKGELIAVVGVLRDITELKQKEAQILNMNATLEQKVEERTSQLLKAKDEAEAANLSKTEFFSRTSHELRTPLNAILGFAQLMDMGELKPAQKKGVDQILKSGKRLLGLVNDVLEISRAETGQLSMSLEPVQLVRVVFETLEAVKQLATDKNISLEFTDSPDNSKFVKADSQKLKKVLLNLLNNAVRFNREGGSVRVECRQQLATRNSQLAKESQQPAASTSTVLSDHSQPPESSTSTALSDHSQQPAASTQSPAASPPTLRITVTDTGIGIAPNHLANLFKPFERIETEITDFVGTGIGLAVVKKLVESMNGILGVESKPGLGSTFWIELPQAESQNDHHERKGDFIKPEPESVVTGTILYIEDNQSNIELVEGILESQRPSVRLITEIFGTKAVKLATENQPDIILLDLDLPDIHGSKVLELLHAEPATATIPVVIISADANYSQLEKLMLAGARNYLTKPINVVEFLKVVDEVMKDRQ